ncbi:uncharacterized protein LOC120277763 [Dioscorea cayenensis subsp. rotundata]|uniref:Uncharacterized protein LOC120277763 n=1 Tax=Dioscorea cayennensis subsp. rotundata TaxID=55577 RepID=A0AB40CKQ3_DIOCR|nr:uncharacterized protein LOC120277763 [Dioscorea cayenensis subsp. rotundata]
MSAARKKFTTEDVLARFMISTEAKFVNINNQFAEVNTTLRNVQASIQSLENQVGQLVRANSERSLGSLPRNTKNNPREHLKAVTLRSGKQVEARAEEGSSTKHDCVAVQEDPNSSESEVEGRKLKQNEETLQLPTPRVPEYKPPIPYPPRLKQDIEEAQFKKFLNEVLAINSLDEFLEGMDSDECKENNPPPTQLKHVGSKGAGGGGDADAGEA